MNQYIRQNGGSFSSNTSHQFRNPGSYHREYFVSLPLSSNSGDCKPSTSTNPRPLCTTTLHLALGAKQVDAIRDMKSLTSEDSDIGPTEIPQLETETPNRKSTEAETHFPPNDTSLPSSHNTAMFWLYCLLSSKGMMELIWGAFLYCK